MTPRTARRRLGATALTVLTGALAFGLVACGTEDPVGVPATTGPTTTQVPPTCTRPEDLGNAQAALDYELKEFTITGPTTGPVGPVAVIARNAGTVPHELVVVRAAGLGALPRTEDGALDEGALDPEAIVAKLGLVAPDQACGIVLDLVAGQYVLVDNLVVRTEEGDQASNLANGMVLQLQIRA